MRRYRVVLILVGSALAVAGELRAQASAHWASRRVVVGIQMIATPRWSLREQTGTSVNREAAYESGWVAGVELGFLPIPAVQVHGAFEANGGGFGDSSGFSAFEGGVTVRPWQRGPVVPFGVASLGRMSESGGVSFGFVTVGAGLELPLARWIAVRVAVRQLEPGDASTDRSTGPGQTTTVDASMTRWYVGAQLRF